MQLVFISGLHLSFRKGLSKDELLEAFDEHFEGLKRFLYYKTGDTNLTEDLIQEIFVKVWERKNSVKQETVKGLLFTIGNNLLIDHFRHKKIAREHENVLGDYNNMEYSSPHFIIEEKEFAHKLDNVLKALPEDCRDIFLMSRIDQLKYNEIAERQALSVKTIEKRMSKAIQIVKEELGVKI